MTLSVKRLALAAAALAVAPFAAAADWPQFRGPDGQGVAADTQATPAEWSGSKNLKWSADLPGQGVSCPIIVGDKVIVTCWSGTGADDLVRHVVCYDRASGKQLWNKDVPPAVKDENLDGMFTQTGYASHTPVSDGEGIYCFFGVSGVYKFDMDGNQVWGPISVGTGFDERHWGSASSPILYKDMVIVTAASESDSMVALKKSDGSEVWKVTTPDVNFNSTWSTPILVTTAAGKQELVVDVPGEIRGLDPETGKALWTCKGTDSNSACASLVTDGKDTIFAILGRRGGEAVAVKAGGEGDVTGKVVWHGNLAGGIGSPVYHDGLLYWVSGGEANCADAATGEQVYKERLEAPTTAKADGDVKQAQATEPAAGQTAGDQQQTPAADQPQGQGQGPGQGGPGRGGPGGPGGRFGGGGGRRGGFGGGGGGGGGGFMQQDYSSPVMADGKLYFVRRSGETFVFAPGRKFEQLAVNKFGDEAADFSASPAVADGQIFIRSSKKIYCVAGSEQM